MEWANEVTFFSTGGWEVRLGIQGYNANDGVEVVQYTGLKDYNGKEIYEGDIVRCQYTEDRGPRFVDVVEWSNCEFKIGTYGLGEIEAEEIIGNIYENPELIEQH
jgi:uncharacterized phage protein (TIGR01671 family)